MINVSVGSQGKEITWSSSGIHVTKAYPDVLMGYEILPDKTGIILLEPVSQTGSENAVIYNIDGTERWRLPFPKDLGSGLLFDRVGMSGGELIVIGIIDGRDVKFVIDHENLKYKDISSTR